jgi:hypothetical protein
VNKTLDILIGLLEYRSMSNVVKKLQTKYQKLSPFLDERSLRIWSAIAAQSLGRGGITKVSEATSLSRIKLNTECSVSLQKIGEAIL